MELESLLKKWSNTLGIPKGIAEKWIHERFSLKEAKQWIKNGFSLESAISFRKEGMSPEDVKKKIISKTMNPNYI